MCTYADVSVYTQAHTQTCKHMCTYTGERNEFKIIDSIKSKQTIKDNNV